MTNVRLGMQQEFSRKIGLCHFLLPMVLKLHTNDQPKLMSMSRKVYREWMDEQTDAMVGIH